MMKKLNEKLNKKKRVLVGGGISAEILLHYYIENFSKMKNDYCLVQIDAPHFYPPCSYASTGVVSKRGAKRGTVLGDLLLDAYDRTRDFIERLRPSGVEKVPCYSLAVDNIASKQCEDFLRRFLNQVQSTSRINLNQELQFELPLGQKFLLHEEAAYLFDVPIFLHWLKQFNRERIQKSNIPYEEIAAVVTSLELPKINLFAQEELEEVEEVILTTGAYSSLMQLPPEVAIQTPSVVAGHYLHWEDVDWGAKSFILFFHESVLVYREETRSVDMGVSKSEQGFSFIADSMALKKIYDDFFSLFPPSILPPFAKAIHRTGLRHRSYKRIPLYQKLAPNIAVMWGTYKNGLSYPHLCSPALITSFLVDS